MKIKYFAALLGFGVAMAACHAQVIELPATPETWRLASADDGGATMMKVTPNDKTATNLLFPTNDPASWNYWFLDKGSSSIVADGDSLKVTVGKVEEKAWKSCLVQQDLPLVEGTNYVLKFRAKASAARAIQFVTQMQGGDFHGVGFVQAPTLSTEWQTFTYPFTAINITSEGVQLAVQVGQATGTVWLADMTLTASSGSSAVQAPASALAINVLKTTSPEWRTHIASSLVNLIEGHKYTLSYCVKSDKPRSFGAVAQIASDDFHAVGKADFRIFAGPVWRYHAVTFTAEKVKPNNVMVVFPLGQITGTVWVGDVKFTEVK
ncbi:MAG TPA: carbohydrate binding domain-containing protein [Capsulimonadaceae bacterium]